MSMEEVEADRAGEALAGFESYEAYLSSFVTPLDRRFLQSEELARQLIEAGINPRTNLLAPEEFRRLKERAERRQTQQSARVPRAAFRDFEPKAIAAEPFFAALAAREEELLGERLSTVLYLRAVLSAGGRETEVSAYIDLGDRLLREDFGDYYSGRRLLLPGAGDLSYYNWASGRCQSSESAYFRPLAEPPRALSFVHRKSRRALELGAGEEVRAGLPGYRQAVFHDHRPSRR